MKKLKTILYLFFILLQCNVSAQYYSTGADPSSTKWQEIRTENFQLIFPDTYASKALVLAAKMDYAYSFVNESMPSKSRRISVIIHTQTANSNGMVAWAPRRMELWTTPSQDAFNYSQEWMEQLIIHETRHFVQENKMNQGFTKVLKVILGEQAEMVPLGLFTRQWFMEGDAVATETALSHSGRGRMPSFEQGLRAMTLEKGKQSYDVAHLGTYKKYVPNHYEIGYHTVAVNRLYKDSLLFDKKMDDIGRWSTVRGLRDSRKIQYYGFAIDYLEKEWRRQDSLLLKTPYVDLLKGGDDYSSYEFLQEDNNKIYAMRTSLSDVPEIVEISVDGKERVVLKRGWSAEPNFSVKNGLLVFSDLQPDPRWDQRSFADLFVVDLKSLDIRRLTKGEVLQAPVFDTSGERIVTQSVDEQGNYGLRLYDAMTGAVLMELHNEKNQFYFSPSWSPDGKQLLYITQVKDKKAICCYDLDSNKETVLVEGTYGEISHPVWSGEYVYFTGAYSGINNIYQCHVGSKETTRITSARFGADYASLLNGKLVYANYTSNGFRPVVHELSDIAGERLGDVEDMGLGLGDMLTAQEGTVIDFTQCTNNSYEVKDYSRLTHLFHIHSWMPVAVTDVDDISLDGTGLYPALSIMSHNRLSTSFLTATYNGDPSKSNERFNVSYDYEGFYPKLGLDVSWGDYTYEDNGIGFNINTYLLRPTISIPLVYKKGLYYSYFTNTLFGEYMSEKEKDKNLSAEVLYGGFMSSFSRVKQSATRDLYTPMAQVLSFRVDFTDSPSYTRTTRLGATAALYLPGFWKHHSFQIGADWQMKDELHSNVVSTPRGYSSRLNTSLSYLSADYYLPIAYPDFHLGSLLNIKRCALGLYGDVAEMHYYDAMEGWFGAGGSAFMDVNFLRYEVDVRIGVQAGVAIYQDEVTTPMNLVLNFSIL